MNGGVFFDPWGLARDELGEWLPEFTTDGKHQTAAASEIVGSLIRAKLLEMVP